MFEQLFGSKTRVKLLSLFLNNPGRPFYVREITRKINEQINSVRRELSNLLSIGIIKSITDKNRLYYEVNQKYQHYQGLHNIFSDISEKNKTIKDTKEEDQIGKLLRTAGTIDLAILSGTFVRDNYAGIDIFIVGDVNKAKIAKIIGDLEKDMQRELNYTIMTPEDYDYRLNLNDRFIAKLMDAKKIIIIDNLNDKQNQSTILDSSNELSQRATSRK